MGRVKDLWMAELEGIFDALSKDGNVEEAKARLRKLGFDEEEVDAHIEAWRS